MRGTKEEKGKLLPKLHPLATLTEKRQGTITYQKFVISILTLSAGIGGFLFGYDTGVISGALPFMRDDLLQEYQSRRHMQNFLEELIVSAAILGAAFGAAIGGWLSDRFGRKRALLVGDGLFTVGALLMATAKTVSILLIGRVVVGLGVGLASVTVPVYIAECSSISLRASLVTVNVLMITTGGIIFGILIRMQIRITAFCFVLGQLVSYIVNYFFTFVPGTWRWMLGVAGVPAVLQFISLCFLPESPRWLFLKERGQQASKVLKLLMPPNEIGDVEEELKEQLANPNPERNLLTIAWAYPEVRYQLSIGVGLQIVQQLCGINTVMYYTPSILELAGYVDKQQALLFSILPALVNSIGTLVGIWCIDRYGRRRLLLCSMSAVLGALLLMAFVFHLNDASSASIVASPDIPSEVLCAAHNCYDCLNGGIRKVPPTALVIFGRKRLFQDSCSFCASPLDMEQFQGICIRSKHRNEYCPIEKSYTVFHSGCPGAYQGWSLVFLMLYLIAFAPGMGPVPWAVNAEIYPAEIRGLAGGAAATGNWVTNFIVSQCFLTVSEALGVAGVFLIYAGFSFVGLLYFSARLPETKGLTFAEIQKLYKSKVLPQQPR